jgi:chemotaxis protein CheZ
MARSNVEQLEQIVTYLKDGRSGNISFGDVISLAEIATQSLRTFFATMDSTVYKELQDIAGYIETMKGEIGGLQANEIKESRIPAAGQELSAIVKATENATNTIMECAEALMAADASDPVAYKALVDAKMMIIFEACSFQDITGQRVGKVVDTLQNIESRVSRFATAVRTEDEHGYLDETEQARAERRKRLLLHGPQLDGQGIAQSDVDSVFHLA